MAIVRRYLDPSNPPTFSAVESANLDAMPGEAIEAIADADFDNPPTDDDALSRAAFARSVRMAREKTGMTQPIFAERFHITLSRLRDWERGRYKPDSVAVAYLKVIESNPRAVETALAAKA